MKTSHVTNGVLEFCLNSGASGASGALHLPTKDREKKKRHVTNDVLEFYLNSGALHLSEKTVTCHIRCS